MNALAWAAIAVFALFAAVMARRALANERRIRGHGLPARPRTKEGGGQ